MGRRKTKLTIQMLAASLFVMLLTVFLFTDNFVFGQPEKEVMDGVEELVDGVYAGSADGYGGPIEVEVTITDGEITDLAVISHEETPGVSDPAFEEIVAAIVDTNSTDVDIVSGATMTSDGLIAAVNNALKGTPGEATEVAEEPEEEEEEVEIEEMTFDLEDGTYEGTAEGHNGPVTVEVTLTDGQISDVVVLEHEETEGASDPAIEGIPEAIVENKSTKVDIISGVTYSSNAIMAAVENALGIGKLDTVYTDGTYEGTADGYGGPLTVEVTVEEGEIASVEVTDHSETDGLADPAIEEVPASIIAKNRPDVDVYSGATSSSDAIMEAVETALADAQAE